jgi:hypothetical protein
MARPAIPRMRPTIATHQSPIAITYVRVVLWQSASFEFKHAFLMHNSACVSFKPYVYIGNIFMTMACNFKRVTFQPVRQ